MGLTSFVQRLKFLFSSRSAMDENRDEGQLWLTKALDLLPKPFFLVNYEQKRITFTNVAARRMLGVDYSTQDIADIYPKKLSIFDTHGNLVPREDLPTARVIRGEVVDGEEFLLVTSTGRYNIRIFSGKIPPMYGRAAGGIIFFQDITALKETEANLLRTQSDLNEAVENAMVGFWSVDKRSMKATISEQIEKQLGLLPNEFNGAMESVVSRIHPEDVERVSEALQKSMETGSLYHIEYRVIHRDGTIRWIEAKSGITGDKNIDDHRFAGTTIDITDRMEARRRLEASEQELRLLADFMPQIVWSAHPSGEFDYFNKVWFDYSGSDLNSNKGDRWIQFVHPEDVPQTIMLWTRALETNEPYENEFRLRHHSGEYRWFVARARPIFKDETKREVKKWYGTNTDIHDQKILTEKLEEARISADRANSAKSQFLANMSHEIRTPLGAIIGFSELIKENGLGRKEREEFISVIERNSSQLLRIIDDILDLSKVEAGLMLIENIAFSFPEMLTDFSSLMGYKAQAKGIQFNSKVISPLPLSIVSDPTRLRQILMNVVGNAIKFTDKGFVELRVKFEDNFLEFEIEDSGRGISEEQAKVLFQPFTQADASTTRKYGGTGLGLVLTRSLAEALEGTFELKCSELGRGSTFVVRVKAQASVGLGFETTPSRSVTSSGQFAGLRVLIVEDSPDNQALISIYLSRAGAIVDIASDGAQGCEMATSADYEIVLMDVQMPVMDGITAVQLLRKGGYEKPIIALTAHAMKEERTRCLAAGFSEFLTKPLTREELMNMIQSFLK